MPTSKVTMRNVIPEPNGTNSLHEAVLFEVPDVDLDAVVADARTRWAEVTTELNQE